MKPFLHGKKSLAIAALRLPSGLAAPASPTGSLIRTGPVEAARPNVEVVKAGDKVVRIIVSCACGERVEVECLYQAGT